MPNVGDRCLIRLGYGSDEMMKVSLTRFLRHVPAGFRRNTGIHVSYVYVHRGGDDEVFGQHGRLDAHPGRSWPYVASIGMALSSLLSRLRSTCKVASCSTAVFLALLYV